MAEILEYALVTLAASLFAFASVTEYSRFAVLAGNTEARAAFNSILTAASRAELVGSSNTTVMAPDSVLGCAGGELYLAHSNETLRANLGVPCDFRVEVAKGVRDVYFTFTGSSLQMQMN